MDWGFSDGSLRFYQADNTRVSQKIQFSGSKPNPPQLIGLFEHVHQSQVSQAIFADSKTLITAGMDCTITIWILTSSSKAIDLLAKGSLFGHRTSVTHLAVSKSFSTLISASTDGVLLLWDLNRLSLIRVIESPSTPKTVSCLAINQTTGFIAVSHTTTITLYTINGHTLIHAQQTCPEQDESITALALLNSPTTTSSSSGLGNDYLTRDLVFTGHNHGVVNIWNLIVHDGDWILQHIRRLDHLDHSGANIPAAICAVLVGQRGVWTGDEDGRVWEWDCSVKR